jgi:hypothetical protein
METSVNVDGTTGKSVLLVGGVKLDEEVSVLENG